LKRKRIRSKTRKTNKLRNKVLLTSGRSPDADLRKKRLEAFATSEAALMAAQLKEQARIMEAQTGMTVTHSEPYRMNPRLEEKFGARLSSRPAGALRMQIEVERANKLLEEKALLEAVRMDALLMDQDLQKARCQSYFI
jgi:hypothetical protein